MRVTVKLFAVLREKAGASEVVLDLADGATVAIAAQDVARKFAVVAEFLPKIAFAVNREYAKREQPLRDGDELALLPAVSGGTSAPADWLAILAQPLPSDRALAFVADPTAGGTAMFLGSTRAESNDAGQMLAALDYEAYAEMATRQFAALATDARKRWPIVKLAILHRVGRVALAEPSVLVAVSTPHRAQAIEACHWLIDQLKSQSAIWKKQVWSDGSGTWVHPKG
jgi:molybdopterin converting factor subunit 1